MMFLLPVAGWLSLLALPVVAFYLLKSRQRRRPVSTLLFWKALRPRVENTPLWRKLRRWISLALQLLILALLVTALARPAFDWERGAPTATIAVLDTSASMGAQEGGTTRFAEALAAVEEAIARLRVTDQMTILTADNPPTVLSGWTSSKRELRAALAGAVPGPRGTDPLPALALAGNLGALRPEARLILYTDSVWPPDAETAAAPDPAGNTSFVGIPRGPATNAGFTLFAVRRSLEAPGDWQLDAEIVATEPFQGTLEVLRDDLPIDRIDLAIEPGNAWRHSWQGSSEVGATFAARLVRDGGDQLAADDSAMCRLPALDPVRVLVAGPANPYLEAILSSIPLVEWQAVAKLPDVLPAEVDLVVVGRGAEPESPLEVPTVLLNPARDGYWGKRRGETERPPVTEVDNRSRLLRHTGFNRIAIDRTPEWTPPPGTDVFASSLGNPLLFGRWDRGERWLVLGFSPDESDLPLRTAFPILIGNIAQSARDAEVDADASAAVLPGATESRLRALAPPGAEGGEVGAPGLPVFPTWWLALLAGLGLVVGEWWLFNRRITD